MSMIKTSWYLCVISLLMVVLSLFITVVPGSDGDKFIKVLTVFSISQFILTGFFALLFTRQVKKNSEWRIFSSKLIPKLYVGYAIVFTLFLIITVAG